MAEIPRRYVTYQGIRMAKIEPGGALRLYRRRWWGWSCQVFHPAGEWAEVLLLEDGWCRVYPPPLPWPR